MTMTMSLVSRTSGVEYADNTSQVHLHLGRPITMFSFADNCCGVNLHTGQAMDSTA